MAPGAVHVVSVLSLLCVSQRPALCLVSDECEHYYDYYVPQLTHSTMCGNGSSGTAAVGCMSLLCERANPKRAQECVEYRADDSRCWLFCAPHTYTKATAAWWCGNNYARLPVVDGDSARIGFQKAMKTFAVGRAWLDGGSRNATPPVSHNRSDWTYSNGTVIPDRFWAAGEPNGDEEACIQWRSDNDGMEDIKCGRPMAVEHLVCECNNDKCPVGAMTGSQCIMEQTKGTMAQECWKNAKQLVDNAANAEKYKWRDQNGFPRACKCAWCTEDCADRKRWTSEWWSDTTTTVTTQSPTVMTTVPQTVPVLMPTVAYGSIKFTRKRRTIEHSHDSDEAMLAAMIILGSVSLLFAVLCATLVTLSAVKHWQHKQRLAKAIHNAGRNRKMDEM